MDDEFEKFLRKVANENKNNNYDAELYRAMFRARLNDEKFDNGCESLDELSAFGWNEYENYDDHIFNNLKYGFKSILDHLKSNLPSNLIKLNEPVERINWSSNDHVEVTAFDMAKQTRNNYKALSCLCTIPLGCLKQSHHHLFQPHLPDEKVRAIENIGLSVVDKIFLVFDRPIFKNYKDVQGMQIFWRDDMSFKLDDQIVNKWNLTVRIEIINLI